MPKKIYFKSADNVQRSIDLEPEASKTSLGMVYITDETAGTNLDDKTVVSVAGLKENYVGVDNTQDINGTKTFKAPAAVSAQEQATTWFETANGGRIGFGKEGPNSGTGIFLEQTKGTRRLNFRGSSTAGAMVWSQPESNSTLFLDVTSISHRGSGTFNTVGNLSVGGNTTLGNASSDVTTVNGSLVLNKEPATEKHATTKQYVDTTVNNAVTTKLSTGGGTITGNLSVNGNTTLGNASTDATTVNGSLIASSATITGNLAISGNTTLGNASSDVTTVNGSLTLTANPTATMHAATKSYVDSYVNSAVGNKLNSSGGTISGNLTINGSATLGDTTADTTTVNGPLILNSAPDSPTHATTKQYVDNTIDSALNSAVGGKLNTSGGTITGNLAVNGNTTLGDTSTDTVTVKGNLTAANETITGNLTVGGNTVLGNANTDTVTVKGPLVLEKVPASPSHAATKQYVDTAVGNKLNTSGGTITGNLTVNGSTILGDTSTDTTTINGNLTADNATVNGSLIAGNTTVSDLMADNITLTFNPTEAMHAVTKSYMSSAINNAVATKLNTSGGTITSNLTVNGNLVAGGNTTLGNASTDATTINGSLTLTKDPTLEMHAATKSYVDSAVGSVGGGGGANVQVVWTGNAYNVSLPMTPLASGFYLLRLGSDGIDPYNEVTVVLPPHYNYGFYSVTLVDGSQQTQMRPASFELWETSSKTFFSGDSSLAVRSVTKVSM